MTIRNQDVKVNRCDSAVLFIALTQSDGTPFDPTSNAVFKWRMVDTSHTPEAEAHIRKDISSGITVVTSPVKGVNVALTKDDTDFPPGIYYHELKVWDTNDVSTTTSGAFIIRRAIKMVKEDVIVPGARNLILTPTAPTKS